MKTRLRLDPDERALLAAVGAHLTRARNTDLGAARRGEKANARYRVLVDRFGIHSRYAGTICVDDDAATKAAKELLWRRGAAGAGLRGAVATLERRTAATPRSVCGCGERRGCDTCRDGYATPNERFQKQRRLAARIAELARVEARVAAKDYPVIYGGRRLAGTRHHLETAGLTPEEWRRAWSEARSWFGCVGNAGRPGGNPCLTLGRGEGGHWYLTVSVPKPVAEQLGVSTRVRLRHPVPLHHRSVELEQRLGERLAVRVDIEPSTDEKGRLRTYLRISWVRPVLPPVDLPTARAGGVVAVDLNADHLARRRSTGPLTRSGDRSTRHGGASVAIGRRALGHGTTRAGRKAAAGRSRRRPVPHQRDGSTAATGGQGWATAVTAEAASKARRPPTTRSHTTALPAPTPIIGCGHAWRPARAGGHRA